MSNSIRVFLVDDNRLLREGLVSMLGDQEDLAVVGAAASGKDALKQIVDLVPDVALIDIGLPGKDGIGLTRALHRDAPEVKVIILGMVDLVDEIMACIEAGAAGYVLIESSFDHLVATMQAVHRGESNCTPQVAASLFTRIAELAGERLICTPSDSVKLTPRELDIVNAIAEGLSNKDIARELSIETQTVKNHIHNILDKLQLHTRFEAVDYARERNLLKDQ